MLAIWALPETWLSLATLTAMEVVLGVDNIVFRAGFASSRNQARQFVRHGHVLVDGKRVTIPSYRVRAGEAVTLKAATRENFNVRHMKPDDIGEMVDLIVADVSFISLGLVLAPIASTFGPEGGPIVALVKPQFEAGRAEVHKGIVRDPAIHRRVLDEVSAAAREVGLAPVGETPSPITGQKGNQEFLLHLRA